MTATPTLVILGNLLVDDIVWDDGSTRMAQPGGAVLYAALGARLWNQSVGCISVAGSDYPAEMLNRLRARGVDLDGVRLLDRPGVRAWLLYEGTRRHLVHRLGCPSHAAVSPTVADLPRNWHDARAFHLSPMPFLIQRTLVQGLPKDSGAFVAVDPHERVAEDTLDDWREVLSQVDAFFVSEDELLLDQARTEPQVVLPQLSTGRLRFIVFKRGAKGGLLYDAHEQRFHEWSARTSELVDQTGAGDAFAAAFVASHVEGLSVKASIERAIVSASVAIEAWGPESLLSTPHADALARIERWFGAENP
jgi:sugar/nucleoside kinase (ribokinase family)